MTKKNGGESRDGFVTWLWTDHCLPLGLILMYTCAVSCMLSIKLHYVPNRSILFKLGSRIGALELRSLELYLVTNSSCLALQLALCSLLCGMLDESLLFLNEIL